MSELNKVVKLKTSKNKVVEYKQQSNIAFQLLVKSQQQEAKLNMQHLLSYPLTTIPYSIATANVFLASKRRPKDFNIWWREWMMTVTASTTCLKYMITSNWFV